MTTRNRELSQFGSFIYVENSTQEIGITTEALPFVGIGTTNPQSKLHVVGDLNVDGNADVGIVSATEYYLNGGLLVDAAVQSWIVDFPNLYRLEEFGSYIYFENSTQEIGITTEALPFVGIGTTNPQSKLHVVGDLNVDGNADVGIISATEYYLNGDPLVDATVLSWLTSGSDIYRQTGNVGIGSTVPTEKLDVDGNITATGNITGNNISLTGFEVSSGIVTASRFISTVTTGTSPLTVTSQTLVTNLNADYLRGKTPPSGTIVGTTDTQTLSNKNIDLATSNLTGTLSQFNTALSDDNFASLTGSETLTNKTLTSPTITSIVNSGEKTIPTGIGTFVITGSTGTVSSGMIADGTIVNADISESAAIAISKLASSTISGISLGSNLNNLTAGSYITYNSGTTYNGSTARTIGVAGTTLNVGNTLVARDASGDFTAGSITCTYLTANTAVTVDGTNLLTTIEQKASTGKAIAMAMIFG